MTGENQSLAADCWITAASLAGSMYFAQLTHRMFTLAIQTPTAVF
jgi:hypothetical protein